MFNLKIYLFQKLMNQEITCKMQNYFNKLILMKNMNEFNETLSNLKVSKLTNITWLAGGHKTYEANILVYTRY